MSRGGTVRVPGDKSISHRALILAAIASGESRVRGVLQSADVHSTAVVLRTLGARIPSLADDMSIEGGGLRSLSAPRTPLECGNSGTTARLMAGVTAACRFSSRFEGDASLSARPMRRVAEPLTAMGARVEFDRDDGLPMTVHGGKLSGISWHTHASSAQTKSAILLAALVAHVPVSIREAAISRDHTERMLRHLGVPVTTEGTAVQLFPVDALPPLDLTVPGDPSSAAFPIALAVLSRGIEVRLPAVCVNPTRTGFIDTLRGAGARIELCEPTEAAGDEVAEVVASSSRLHAIEIGPSAVPSLIDELPLLGCVAAAAGIPLIVSGARELRVKESDRIRTLVGNLQRIGANAEERPDGFAVSGSGGSLRGDVITEGDHRIAMAFGVLRMLPGNDIRIDDMACVSVSYPHFWEDMASLA